jgi:hypothetical protein
MIAFARMAVPVALVVAGALAVPHFLKAGGGGGGGDEPSCCQSAKKAAPQGEAAARASKAIEMWKAMPERVKTMSAEDSAQVAAAQAVTDRSCPVCKELPATLAYLRDAFHADAALKAKILQTCHGANLEVNADSPALELISFAIASTTPAKADCCAGAKGPATVAATATVAAAEPSCCAAPAQKKSDDCCAGDPLVLLNGLSERAAKLEALWSTTVPQSLASVPAADKAELDKALATQMKLNPRMPAMIETMSVLRELAASSEGCGGGAACEAKPELKDVSNLMTARADLQKKTLAILDAMAKICGGPAGSSSCCAKDSASAAN